eukprot:6209203-Pleurochrysis_carterae.AAC.1
MPPGYPLGGIFLLRGRGRSDRSGRGSWACRAGGTVPRAKAGDSIRSSPLPIRTCAKYVSLGHSENTNVGTAKGRCDGAGATALRPGGI